jgi:hypothetical protein
VSGEGEGSRSESTKKNAPRVRWTHDGATGRWRQSLLNPAEAEAEEVDKTPRRPAFDLDPATPSLEAKIRKAHARAVANAWAVRLTGAESWDGKITVALRARRHRNLQVVMLWTWAPERWGVSKGEPKFFPAGWVNTNAWIVDPLIVAVTHTEAMAAL